MPPATPMPHRLIFFLCAALVLLALCVCGCSGGSGRSTSVSKLPLEPPVQEEPLAESKPRVDESLTTEEYLRRGLPPLDRDWTPDDWLKAAKVLLAVRLKGAEQLPRYKSERSGAVFAHLTSMAVIDRIRQKGGSPADQFPLVLNVFQARAQIFKLYLAALEFSNEFDSEVVEMMAMQYRTLAVLFDLTEAYLATFKKDDPSYAVRAEGIDKMKRAAATLLGVGLAMLTQRQSFRLSERRRFVRAMEETFPRILPHLEAPVAADIVTQVDRLIADPSLKELQPDLQELARTIKPSPQNKHAPR